jgi:hypothetical protein
MGHHGRQARRPQRHEWNPGLDHLDWHLREVFKGKPRRVG